MNLWASILNMSGVAVKMLAAPLILFIISSKFESQQVVIYFLCLSFLNLRTIFEGGITNVVKREYALGKLNTGSIVSFSILWFSISSCLLFLVSSFFSVLYFKLYVNDVANIDIFLIVLCCLFSALRVSLLSIDAYTDGNQNQVLYRKSLLASNVLSTLINVVMIYLGFSILAIAVSQMTISIVYFYYNRKQVQEMLEVRERFSKKQFLEFFSENKTLLYRTVITWTFGYFFWNSTALVTNVYSSDVEFTSSVIFSFALVKAIYDISFAFTQTNLSRFSYVIGKKNKTQLVKEVKSSFLFSVSIFFAIIILVLLFRYIYPTFGVFDKLLLGPDFISLYLFFFLVLLKSLIHNTVRAFHEEPFTFYVFYNSIVVSVGICIGIYFKIPLFSFQIIMFIPMLLLSLIIFWSRLNNEN
ncbi:TPA: hypothetical protein RQJ52_002769 [Vibrio vulnificus]|nr:hypothetical protein [Vibrio vulnificus]HDY7464348.1 hypothetical protein [Vibrio vulnificus]HDY7627972.1 hypothetical protein [Vibrio vulnificus]